MRAFAALVLVVCGCYHPTVASDVPCSTTGGCPDGQRCDYTQSPPTCVAGDGGTVGSGSDARAISIDARPDGPMSITGDARQPDAYVVPILYVQSKTIKPTTSPTTLALNNNVTEHDAIIVCFNFPTSAGATFTSLTDSLGNTYNVVVNDVVGNAEQHYIAAAYNVNGGADTLSLELSATVSGADMLVVEYSGLATTNAYDVYAAAMGSGTAMSSGNSPTTTFAHELLVGYAEAPSASMGTGFAQRAMQSGNIVEDSEVFATGAYAATATTTSGGWEMLLATFKGQ